MIEALAKAAEGLEKTKETKSNFNPDKKLEKNNPKTDKPKEGYDPDKKVEKKTEEHKNTDVEKFCKSEKLVLEKRKTIGFSS